ncbi:hypothetical protein BDZ97DRAFT_1912949 [Flammula alnicola]|nr:hypothetical protein BDZ97DRAFT_1912949 [Flammula alnicola]
MPSTLLAMQNCCYILSNNTFQNLTGLSTQMGNYMRGLEVTRSPEPVACLRVRRWLCFLAHVTGETPPPFAFLADFDPSHVADFYPLHVEEVSDSEMNSEPPFPNFVGLARRLLEATWVHSPIVGPLVAYSPSPSPVLAPVPDRDLDEMRSPTSTPAGISPTMDHDGARLSSPPPIPSLTARPEDRLRCFVEIPPRRSKGRKGKGKARARTPSPSPAPPSPPRALMTRAAAARLAASSHQEVRPGVASGSQVTLDVSPAPPRPLKRKVAALGDARSKRPRREVTPESPEPDSSSSSKLAAAQLALLLGRYPNPWRPPAKLKDQMPDFETFLEFGQSSLTNLQNLFERLQRISATNVLQRALVVRATSRSPSCRVRSWVSCIGLLHRIPTTHSGIYTSPDDAMETLIDVLSALSPGDLSSNDRHPLHSTSLSELSLLLQGVATPPWLLHPATSFLLTLVSFHIRRASLTPTRPLFLDTDSERATLDALDRDVGDLTI